VKSGQTLVNCDHEGYVNSHKILTNLIDVEQSVDLYGDAAVQFTPQTSAGTNVAGYTYRFGKNQEELGDFSPQGDGLEMKEPSGNELLIQVNDITPTIEIRRVKNPGVETLLVRTPQPNDHKLLSIDDDGVHLRRDDQNVHLLTPGNALSVENEGLSDDLIGAGKGKLKTAFGKMAKGKIASRPLLNKFVKMVA